MLVCIGKAYEKHKFLTATERLMYAYIVYERKAFRMTILSISYSLTHIHTPLWYFLHFVKYCMKCSFSCHFKLKFLSPPPISVSLFLEWTEVENKAEIIILLFYFVFHCWCYFFTTHSHCCYFCLTLRWQLCENTQILLVKCDSCQI